MLATASTQDKLDWLLSLPNGATNAANYKTEDFSQVAREVTQGKGVDVVIDFVSVFFFGGAGLAAVPIISLIWM